MITRLIVFTLTPFIWMQMAAAESPTLSINGAFLGRAVEKNVTSELDVIVDLQDDVPIATYVMARFQSNAPLQLLPDGTWQSWSEDRSDLVDTQFTPNADGTLTFKILDSHTTLGFAPIVFTVAYMKEDGSLKSGYVVVDQ